MKRSIAAVGLVAAALLGSSPAWALTITMDAVPDVALGVAQAFHATTTDAVGTVTYRWNFGDGTVVDFAPGDTATHTYQTASHYTLNVVARDDAATTGDHLTFAAHAPLTSTAPSHSSSIIYDATRHQTWNVNPDSDSVSVIDTTALMRTHEIAVGKEPHSLAQAPDGSIWVSNQLSDEVVVIDPDTGNIATRIPLSYASAPRSIVFAPSGLAYVTLYATGKIAEIDPGTRMVKREVDVGPTPAGVSVAADGRIFVTRFISPVDHGEVWVLSPDTLAIANTIQLPFDMTADSQSGGRGVPNYVSSFVISPDGTQAWVTAKKDNTARGMQRDGQPMTPDNFVRSAICAIDMTTEKEMIEKRQDIDNRSTPVSVAFSPIGDYAYILVQPDNWIGITDAYTTENLSGINKIGNAPDGFVLLPDGRLLVNAFLSRQVIAYDLSKSIASIDHTVPPALATITTIDHEPLPADVLLGKQVFFNAADTRMGHAEYWACVSCHFGGTSDGRVWDFTDRGEGLRNTKSLLGARGVGEGRVHWSANMDEIQDFERDIRDSFQGSGFMSDDEYNARKGANGVYDPLGKPAAGVSPELDGLAAYFATFDKVPRSPFRNADGSFSKDARAGRKVFEKAGCAPCHNGADFTDSAGGAVHDVGTLLPTSGDRLGGPLTGIDTPTLKGVWQSAPYLHDGRAATLRGMFTDYTKDKMGVISTLADTELDQLVRYLQELDDVPETVVPDDPVADPMMMDTPTAGTSAVMPTPIATAPRGSTACSFSPVNSRQNGADWLLGVGLVAAAAVARGRRRVS